MEDTDSDQYGQLQDILDEVVGGRPSGHPCPFCGEGPLEVIRLDEGGLRLECPSCNKFFEGTFR